MDEKPESRNRNLPGVESALGSFGASAAGLNSRSASPAAGISVDTSLIVGSEGEWILAGVPTWIANVLTGCSPPEASIKRCSADLLASACSEGDDAVRIFTKVPYLRQLYYTEGWIRIFFVWKVFGSMDVEAMACKDEWLGAAEMF